MDNAIIDILHIPHSKRPSSLPPILARDSAWLDILTFAKRLLHGDYGTALLQGKLIYFAVWRVIIFKNPDL